jgi:hypothetical protein
MQIGELVRAAVRVTGATICSIYEPVFRRRD